MSKPHVINLLLVLAMMAVGTTLSGCSGGSGTSTSTTVNAAKADVTVSVAFPSTATAVKSLIPLNAQAIYVYVQAQGGTYPQNYSLKLTKATPAGTLKLALGNYFFYASAYPTTEESQGYPVGSPLAQTSTGGVINLGSNTVNLNFLNGQWTLVNSSDVPTPIVLSNGTQFKDMVIGEQPYGMAAKAAIDFSKPIGGGGGNQLRYRFDNNSSARTYGSMLSQFIGTANELVVEGGEYNLTKKCSGNYLGDSGMACEPGANDQMVFIPGLNKSSSYGSSGAYENELLYGYASYLLPNNGYTYITQNGIPFDLESKFTAGTVTGGTVMTGTLVEFLVSSASQTMSTVVSPASSAKASSRNAIKAQSANTPYTGISVTNYKMYICATKTNPSAGTWQFESSPMTIGTATCYNFGYLRNFGPTGPITPNAGDFSYGLVPTDTNNLGDYCHKWDHNPQSSTYNTCLQKQPDAGEIYYPSNFTAKKTATKTTIDYGSFKVNFHVQRTQSGTAYTYPLRAKGSSTITPLQ